MLNQYVKHRIYNLENCDVLIIQLKMNKKKIVFTNGCFDILHRGHLDYLWKAKELGDILVIGLNSDKSVFRLKGKNRPINNEYDRATMLLSLKPVDYVIIFEQDTPEKLIAKVQPDILVKGGDYKKEDVIGYDIAKETVILPFLKNYSTSSFIKRILTTVNISA
ncbi:MAG: D-glycero-beta-D-manno-heptose 1-phosphate adenylyltransferase [Candidatus Cloacimonadota bacterium]|nr:MAG: D-glycero-beta-D-manno-heptose 1-phosphate adenylyltransferase [Candidatus Cloacimonadota bacterium]